MACQFPFILGNGKNALLLVKYDWFASIEVFLQLDTNRKTQFYNEIYNSQLIFKGRVAKLESLKV